MLLVLLRSYREAMLVSIVVSFSCIRKSALSKALLA